MGLVLWRKIMPPTLLTLTSHSTLVSRALSYNSRPFKEIVYETICSSILSYRSDSLLSHPNAQIYKSTNPPAVYHVLWFASLWFTVQRENIQAHTIQ